LLCHQRARSSGKGREAQLRRELMKTYVQYPPRKLQSMTYTRPITLSNYQRFQWIREQLEKEGVDIPLPGGN
jgi:hypothetical protein